MICPKCNRTYDDKISICPECGTELIEESEFTSELEDKIEDNIEKIDDSNKLINEKNTRSGVEIFKEQWLIMREDEENYKKFMENGDSEAFDKLVKRLVEHYKNEESAETDEWFVTYEENKRNMEEDIKNVEENSKKINEILREIIANDKYIRLSEERIQEIADLKEERKRIEQRTNEVS